MRHVGQSPNSDSCISRPQFPKHDLLDLGRAKSSATDGFDIGTVHVWSLLSIKAGFMIESLSQLQPAPRILVKSANLNVDEIASQILRTDDGETCRTLTLLKHGAPGATCFNYMEVIQIG